VTLALRSPPVPFPLLFMTILHATEASHKRIRRARPRGVAQQTNREREARGTGGEQRVTPTKSK
jgi:hypothetical protein